jgi:hypothetical protein
MSKSNYNREITLPVSEDRVLILNRQADSPRSVHLRHLGKSGQTGPATVKWQESQDNVNWNDIAGTSQIVDAGQGTAWLITSTKPYVALAGYGNVDVEVDVNRTDPDSTLPQTVNF